MELLYNLILPFITALLVAEYRTKDIIKQSELERKNHISKARFETEFLVFQELSKCIFDMYISASQLFPLGIVYEFEESDEEKETLKIEKHKKAKNDINKYTEYLYKSTPFITDENMFKALDTYRGNCRYLSDNYYSLNWGILRGDNYDASNIIREYKLLEKTEELNSEMNNLYKIIREYIYSKEIVDK